MFSCGACFRRALQSLVYDFGRSGISTGRISGHGSRQQIAHHSTVESIRRGHHRRLLNEALRSKSSIPPPASDRRRGHLSRGAKSDLVARRNNKDHLEIAQDGKRTSSVANSDNFDIQIQYLKDPLKLATAVLTRLRNADVEGALNLVRASDKEKLENVVSWNHLMDYQMSVKKTRAALSVYNEVIPVVAFDGSVQWLTRRLIDEETGSSSRCSYLYNHASRLHAEHRSTTSSAKSSLNLQFYVCDQFCCLSKYHPYQCYHQCLRSRQRHGCDLECCWKTTRKGCWST